MRLHGRISLPRHASRAGMRNCAFSSANTLRMLLGFPRICVLQEYFVLSGLCRSEVQHRVQLSTPSSPPPPVAVPSPPLLHHWDARRQGQPSGRGYGGSRSAAPRPPAPPCCGGIPVGEHRTKTPGPLRCSQLWCPLSGRFSAWRNLVPRGQGLAAAAAAGFLLPGFQLA